MKNVNFSDYKLGGEILKALNILGFNNPTKVQEEVIPVVLKQKDIIVKSQTGSGKTGAFAIPICELIDWDENKPQALVLAPTRELAIQVKEEIVNIGRFKRIKVACIYGKASFEYQEKEVKQKTHFVVGTPGRVIDHLKRGTLDLSNVKYVIIDEADKMLEMGFIDQIESVFEKLPDNRVTMLFSATMPIDIENLCAKHLKEPVTVRIEDENMTTDRIIQERYSVDEVDKMELLKDLIVIENPESCMIFCNTKQKVDEVYEQLRRDDFDIGRIHGDLEQNYRIRIMDKFKTGRFRYLVATDVAARGIDVDDISLVVNYDTPYDVENYVHRIGRTGRKTNSGKSITLVSEYEKRYLGEIHKYIKKEILLKESPDKNLVIDSQKEFDIKNNTKPKIKVTKGDMLSKEILKLHINAGKKTKMRPVDIVGTLCSLDGISAEDIGIINILDTSTFVEILNRKGKYVLEKLQTTQIKGRLRKVTRFETQKP